MSLNITFFDTAEFSSPQIFNNYFSQMSEYRQNKINQAKNQKDKNLSLAAGILIQKALTQRGIDEKSVIYAQNKNGKSFITNYPELHFNVSHSGTFAMAVFADFEVGCDIEKVKTIDLKIPKRFFCPAEYEKILSQKDVNAQTELFYRFWTIKESFLKATGFGLSLPMNKFEVNLNEKVILPVEGFTNRPFYFKEVECPLQTASFKASVCAEVQNL